MVKNPGSRYVEKLPKCWIFGELARLGPSLAGVWVPLMARCVDIGAPNVVLSTVWHAGVPIVKSNEKSQLEDFME